MTNKEDKKRQFNKLMKLIQRNPQKGLHLFYEKYSKILQITAYTICRSIDKANEVVNDVLLKIWKLAQTTVDIENPEGWIYVITLNTAKNSLPKHNSFPLKENIIANEDAFKEIFDRDSFCWMIRNLSEVEQKIMIHKFVLQYTFQEMADELNRPLTTVTSIYYRALEKIKKDIEEKI